MKQQIMLKCPNSVAKVTMELTLEFGNSLNDFQNGSPDNLHSYSWLSLPSEFCCLTSIGYYFIKQCGIKPVQI